MDAKNKLLEKYISYFNTEINFNSEFKLYKIVEVDKF